MNLHDIDARMGEIKPELIGLAETPDLDADGLERFETLKTEWDSLEEARPAAEAEAARLQRVRDFAQVPAAREAGAETWDRDFLGDPAAAELNRNKNPWDPDAIQRAIFDGNVEDLHARALSAAELTPGPSDARREALSRIIEASDDEDGTLSRVALVSTAPAYKRAFAKLARSGGMWHELDAEESAAVRLAQRVQRAMSVGTDNAGGYLVPTDIESAVTLATAATTNPIFEIARRVQTTSDTYRVVTSTSAAWSWDAENAEVSDDTPTFANTDIPLYTARGFVPVSIEAMAALNATENVSRALSRGWVNVAAAAVTTGSGSSQPTGIVTALTGGSYVVASAATDTFAVGDVYAVHDLVPAEWRANGSWLANPAIINKIRQFASNDGHALLSRLPDGQPPQLLGRPLYEASGMDSSVTASSDNLILVFGDFDNFVIAEGLASTVEFIPHVFSGSNGRPIGARGFFAYHRFGSDSVHDAAFGMLNVT